MSKEIERQAESSIKAAKNMLAYDKNKLISRAILCDVMDRGGVKRVFESLSDETIREVLETWEKIVQQVLEGR